MRISEISTRQLREAALAWRKHDVLIASKSRLLFFKLPQPSFSLHDRIDDLIGEIERLRETAK